MRSSQQINTIVDENSLTHPFRKRLKQRITSHEPRITNRQRAIAAIIFVSIALFFSIFAFAAHSNIDMGNYFGHCGFKAMYHLPCPTCGYTTAAIAFAQGKILEAFDTQPACALICSVLVFIGVISFIIAVFGIRFRFVSRFFNEVKIQHIILALIIIILSGWAVTLARAIAQN
jgi:hypothetical protein